MAQRCLKEPLATVTAALENKSAIFVSNVIVCYKDVIFIGLISTACSVKV